MTNEMFILKVALCPGCQAGQTPLSIADRLGYISVVEILRHVTEVTVTTPTDGERYKVMSPEVMQEAAMSDVEGDDEGLRSCLCSCFILSLVRLCVLFWVSIVLLFVILIGLVFVLLLALFWVKIEFTLRSTTSRRKVN